MVARADSDRIARLVQRHMRDASGFGRFVRVEADAIRRGEGETDWWYVPVMYEQDPYHVHEYFELLSDVEDRVREREGIDVLLVPRIHPPSITTAQTA